LLVKATTARQPPSSVNKEKGTKSVDAGAIRIFGGMAVRNHLGSIRADQTEIA